MASTEDFAAAGLFDAAGDVGTGRLELLHWLSEKGFSIEEMSRAFQTGALGALAGDRRLMPGPRLSNRDAQGLVGLSADRFSALATAFGFNSTDPANPDELSLSQQEAETLALFGAVATMFSDEEMLGFVRVVGSSVERMAEAAVALFLVDVEGPALLSSDNELDLAKNVLSAIEILDDFIPMLDPVLRRHVFQATERSRLAMIDEQERLQYRYAVGFVDLVGFTPLSREMTASELGVFLREFEARAHDAVTAVGARLVKLIGDEVMFVAPNVDSAWLVAKTLMAEQQTADGRTVVPRGGMAYGPVLVRGGDYYGDVVNMASRLADEAAPSQLLVTEDFAAASASTMGLADPVERTLKGFAEPVPVRSRSFD